MISHENMKTTTHKGFTLIELIIVVLLISLVSFMAFSTVVRSEKKKVETLDPSTLPTLFRKSFKGQGDVELYCVNKCKECYVMQNGKISSYEGGINFGKDVEIHQLDDDNHFVEMDELGRLKDQKICLRYHLYPNGSTTQMVITNSEGIYFLPSYFGKSIKVKEMEEAKLLWIKEEYSLRDSGSFY